jgi:Family of unknown function (DUF6093)
MLADEIARVLPDLRREAESRMTSRATVRRAGGTTTDPDEFEVSGWTDVLESTPCRVGGAQAGPSNTRTVTVGGIEAQVAVRTLHLPAGTTGLRDNDLVEVTAGECAGTVLRVIEATGADQQTALRLPVFEVPRPEEWP